MMQTYHFFSVYIIWGITFIWMKVATETIDSLYVVGFENLIAAILLLSLNFRKKNVSFFVDNWKEIISQSLLQLVFGVGFIVMSIPYLPAGFSAVIMATIPINVLLFSIINEKERINKLSLIHI